jgi:hypothetical protein
VGLPGVPRGSGRAGPRTPADVGAAEDASRHAARALDEIAQAAGADWRQPGGAADRVALTLCRLRRARAGELGGIRHGDEAVRESLRHADHDALVWFASRALAYMDESGFPEAVEPWVRSD